jgi:hypothetical protein
MTREEIVEQDKEDPVQTKMVMAREMIVLETR